jgi:DNA repair exonuclease SbcCD ATPase subunit
MPPKSAKAPVPDTAAPAADTPENLDKVRDILFGGHMRAVEGRIARVEERLLREQSALRSDLETAIAGLEAYARKELDALGERLKAEREKRAEDLKALGADLREAIKALDRRLAKLDEATSLADADLRSQLMDQKRVLAADIKQLGDQLMAELRRAQQELREEKADLAAVVAAFSEMAVRLSERLPDKPKK